MTEKTITVTNRAGVHARPSALIVQTTKNIKSSVYMEKEGVRINAKSIMGVITLAAAYGAQIKIIAEGPDEAQAVDAIAALFASNFEGDQP